MGYKRRGFDFYFFSTSNRAGKAGIVFFKKSVGNNLSGDFAGPLPLLLTKFLIGRSPVYSLASTEPAVPN